MAQTRKKRRKKHRGTQAGTIERSASASRSRGRGSAASTQRRPNRLDRPPSLRGALNRAAFAAAIFGLLLYFWFEQPWEQAAGLSAFMLLIYVPLGYFTDRLLYDRRMRKKQAS